MAPQWVRPLATVRGRQPSFLLSTRITLEVKYKFLISMKPQCVNLLTIFTCRFYESRNAESNAGVQPPAWAAPPLWSRTRNRCHSPLHPPLRHHHRHLETIAHAHRNLHARDGGVQRAERAEPRLQRPRLCGQEPGVAGAGKPRRACRARAWGSGKLAAWLPTPSSGDQFTQL